MLLLLLVALTGFRVGRAFFPTLRRSAKASFAPAQPRCRRPRRRDLHANKKKKGRGRGRAGAPCASRGACLPQPSALGVLLAGFGLDPRFSPRLPTSPPAHTHPPSRHLSEGFEFTPFVWMLSAPPPPTPTFATLTLTPARAGAAGECRRPRRLLPSHPSPQERAPGPRSHGRETDARRGRRVLTSEWGNIQT